MASRVYRALRTAQRNRLLPLASATQRPASITLLCDPRHTWVQTQHRPFSLASIFPRSPLAVPSPESIASVQRLEVDADSNPSDPQKHVALFQALLKTNVKQGSERLMARWERLIQFSPHSPLVKSDPLFQLYLSALMKSGNEKSIMPATRAREAALTLPLPSPVSQTGNEAVSVSSSELIAQAVLRGETVPVGSNPTLQATTTSKGNIILDGIPSNSGLGVTTNPIVVTLKEPRGTALYRFARFVVALLVGAFLVLVFFSVLLERSGLLKAGANQTTQFKATKETKPVKFNEVHGCDEAKEELQEVVEFLKDPTKFSTLGGKLPKGVLLTGPPGTGKTLLARAVAGEAGVPFLFASASEFDEIFVGMGAKRIRDLFAMARKQQPAIIFIDELDAIGSSRNVRDQNYLRQTLNQFLTELDGFTQSEGVVVIAATNFPQSLDKALVRPGRFDKHVAVPLPDITGRTQILRHYMKDVIASTDVDPLFLARGTPGMSGADLKNMVNQAAIQASRQGQLSVQLRHFEWARDRILMGAERRSQFIPEKEKRNTAYHEAGHAITALYTEGAMPLHKVTCMPRGHALGITWQLPENDRHSVSRKEHLAEIDVCMGGTVSELIIHGPDGVSSGATSDLQHATSVARRMVLNYGYSEKVGPIYIADGDVEQWSPETRRDIDNEVRSILEMSRTRVFNLLKEREVELHRLADALVEYETLDAAEVRQAVRGEDLKAKSVEMLKES